MLEIFTNLWFYAFILLIVIIILILYKLKIINFDQKIDPETELAKRATELIKKEKELKKEIDNLYKDSVVVDNLRELMDNKHSAYKEFKTKVKTHDKELNEIKKVLKITDNLLEKLPEEEIEKFVKSKKFRTYKKVIEKHVK